MDNEIGVFDTTPDIAYTIAVSDGYIGSDGSSVINMFSAAGKPVFIFNDLIFNEFSENEKRNLRIINMAVKENELYFVADSFSGIFRFDITNFISGRGEDSSSLYTQVDRFVRTLRKSVVVELEDKVETDEQADGDYIVDEKHKTCTLTAKGIKKAEEYFKIENLAAAENMTLAHHIDQAIKAYGVMQRDIDYVVKDGEVLIVDEFTGRLMIGRRYNEGLHQAIEAKEGVKIAAESKTLATITFQIGRAHV